MLSFNKLYERMLNESNLNLNDSGLDHLAQTFNCYCRVDHSERHRNLFTITFAQQDHMPVQWDELTKRFKQFLELYHLDLVNDKKLDTALIFYVSDNLHDENVPQQ